MVETILLIVFGKAQPSTCSEKIVRQELRRGRGKSAINVWVSYAVELAQLPISTLKAEKLHAAAGAHAAEGQPM